MLPADRHASPGSSDGNGPKIISDLPGEPEVEASEGQRKVDDAREERQETDHYEAGQTNIADQKTTRQVMQRRATPATTFATQGLLRTEAKLTKLREEMEAVLELLADSEWSSEAIGRHGKKLGRIRGQTDDSSRRHRGQSRALWEAQVGLTDLDESKLTLALEKLGQVRTMTDLLALIAELGNGQDAPRRLVIRRADHPSVIDYASASNPTTAYLDTPFVAAGFMDPPADGGSLGRTLTGQQALSQAAA